MKKMMKVDVCDNDKCERILRDKEDYQKCVVCGDTYCPRCISEMSFHPHSDKPLEIELCVCCIEEMADTISKKMHETEGSKKTPPPKEEEDVTPPREARGEIYIVNDRTKRDEPVQDSRCNSTSPENKNRRCTSDEGHLPPHRWNGYTWNDPKVDVHAREGQCESIAPSGTRRQCTGNKGHKGAHHYFAKTWKDDPQDNPETLMVELGEHPGYGEVGLLLEKAKNFTKARMKAETCHILAECGLIVNDSNAPPTMKGLTVRINDSMKIGDIKLS